MGRPRARWPEPVYKALGVIAVFLLIAAGPAQQPNWGRTWWGMSPQEFSTRYPGADVVDGEVWLPASRIPHATPLADLIEPNSNLRLYFTNGGVRLYQIEFISAFTYDEIMPRMQRVLGHQAEGEDTEANCFEADGSRKISDPSGVGHVLSICLGEATFLDRVHGNFVEVTAAGGAPDRFRPTPSDTPYQYITLRSIEDR